MKDIKIEPTIKCECGDDAIFSSMGVRRVNEEEMEFCASYCCYHYCDKETVIKFKILVDKEV